MTRDRIYAEVEWAGKTFRLVDTGGIVPDDEAIIPTNIFKQASNAISEAQAIIWVVDARSGAIPLDEEIGILLRNVGKPIFIAANKSESRKVEEDAAEFYKFGFELTPVSAENGNGVGDMLDGILEVLTFEDEIEEEEQKEIKLAIIGRPNVGKSSLLNKILGEERVIVSPIAGTTRDAIDTELTVDGQKFILIDTAGIRRKGKTIEMSEKLSVIMARKALERADVAILVMDATEGFANSDATIAGYALDSGCSIIIAVNKWDAIEEKETNTANEFEKELRYKMKFLDWSPILTISALTGQRVAKILPIVQQANEARNLRVTTSKLNAFFEKTVSQPRVGGGTAPGSGGNVRLHVQFITQAGLRPPLFVIFTSGGTGGKGGLHFSYLRYIENQLREAFDFFATPIRLKEKHKTKKGAKR
ncbi:MAG: ribosome biogenesis GTPase Der [Acidobacteriota bacterium]|nr:ribosome biogenesis GTPase Der [Acidobacteriota bacterium]